VKARIYVLAMWFAFAAAASLAGWTRAIPVPALMVSGFVIPFCLFYGALTLSPRSRRFIETRDLRITTLLEASRITGLVFFIGYASGALPALFGLTTGSLDTAIGFTALLAAGASRDALWLWHVAGIASLLISGSFGILTAPAAMAEFPWALVPTFLGPVTLLLHLTSLTALKSLLVR
jgi:hypothetical protein